MRITLLGTGGSAGVPRLGGADGRGDWGACDPTDPRNRRRRASLLVEHGDVRLLIDTGPDLREQLLSARVTSLTGVLYTHGHADHTHGIDDLRPLFHQSRKPVDLYMNAATQEMLHTRFSYVFLGFGEYPPMAVSHIIRPQEPVAFDGLTVTPFLQEHGHMQSLGFRFEDGEGTTVAYSTDVNGFPEESWAQLSDLDLWIVDALQKKVHPSHSNLHRTLQWIARAQPKEAWLTHMDKQMDYREVAQALPEHVSPGYDGRTWTRKH